MILIDAHLDLSMNALQWNRDLTQGVYDIRRQEEGMAEKGRARTGSVPRHAAIHHHARPGDE